jgi:hypothetical protein
MAAVPDALVVGRQAPEWRPGNELTEAMDPMMQNTMVDPIGPHDEVHTPVHRPSCPFFL